MRPNLRHLTTILLLTLFLLPGLLLAHGKGHVMGTIEAVAADHLEVKTKDGKTVTVKLTATTLYKVGEAKGAASDLKVGSRVVVHLGDDGSAAEVHLPKGD